MNVFSLFASIELDDKAYKRSLDNAERNTDKFGNNVRRAFDRVGTSAIKLGTTLTKTVTASIIGAGSAALLAADRFAAVADRVDKSSQLAGLAAEDYQTLRFAFEQSGITAESFDLALGSLNRRLGLAAQGNKTYADAFQALGVATRDANGDVRDSRSIFDDLIVALQAVPSSAEQAALASVVFGDDVGKRLLPVINQGAQGIAELEQQARDLGLVIEGESIAALVAYQDRMNALRRSLQTAGVEITAAFLPALDSFADFIRNRAVPAAQSLAGRVNDLIAAWQSLSPEVQNAVGVIVAALGAAGPVVTVVGIASKAIAALLTPWGLIAAAVAGFVVAYRTNFLGLRDITEPVVTFIVDALGKVITIGRNIVSNWTTVSRGFSLIISAMGELAGSVARLIGAQFNLMRVGVEETFIALGRGITTTLAIALNTVLEQFNFVLEGLGLDPIDLLDPDGFDQIAGDMTASIDAAKQAVADARKDITDDFKRMVGASTEFYNMITDDTPAIVEGIESTGEAATTAAGAVTPAFGDEIPTALGTTTDALSTMSTTLNDLETDWARFTLSLVERTEGPIETVTDLYEAFSKLGLAVTPELLALVTGRVAIPVPTPSAGGGAVDLVEPTPGLGGRTPVDLIAPTPSLGGAGAVDLVQPLIEVSAEADNVAMGLRELGDRAASVAQRSFPVLANAMQAFATGGPLAALASVFMDLIGRTEGFQRLIEAVNRLLDPLVDALEPLLNAVVSVVEAFGPLFEIVGKLIEGALAPLVFIIEKVVAPVFTGIAEMLRNIYNALFGWLFGRIERDNRRLDEAERAAGRDSPFSEIETPRGAQPRPTPDQTGELRNSLVAESGGNIVYYFLDSGSFLFRGPTQGTQNEAGLNARLSLLRRLQSFATTPRQRQAIQNEILTYENMLEGIVEPPMLGINPPGGRVRPVPLTPEPDMAPSPGFDEMTPREFGASIGQLPQGVQLAVAVPLLDAANAFGSHVSSFGGYIDRLVTEGIAVNMGATSRTAALR